MVMDFFKSELDNANTEGLPFPLAQRADALRIRLGLDSDIVHTDVFKVPRTMTASRYMQLRGTAFGLPIINILSSDRPA